MAVHINLDNISVAAADIDKLAYGIMSIYPRASITASSSGALSTDMLDALSGNAITIIKHSHSPPKSHQITISPANAAAMLKMQPLPQFAQRAIVYYDWDNIPLAAFDMAATFAGIAKWVNDTKYHPIMDFYVFADNSAPVFPEGVQHIILTKSKTHNSDGEIIRFIRQTTRPDDSIVIVSGDRDFSAMMVEYVRNGHNAFLIYNHQAHPSFKHNRHWIASRCINNLRPARERSARSLQAAPAPPSQKKVRPCRFFNTTKCITINCQFPHICGTCGRPHKMTDFHPNETPKLKNTICASYNESSCSFAPVDCASLHICARCYGTHSARHCEMIMAIPSCPLCGVTVMSSLEFAAHMLGNSHAYVVRAVRRLAARLCKYDYVLCV